MVLNRYFIISILYSLHFIANPLSGQTIRRLAFKANDIIYNAQNDCIYATAPSDNLGYGNSLCKLDPITGRVLQSVFIGTEPHKLAISDDSQYLYVSFENIPRIVRLKLPELTTDLTIPLLDSLYSSSNYTYAVVPYYIKDMAVFPKNPKKIALALKSSDFDYSDRLVIYDDKTLRPNSGYDPLYLNSVNNVSFVGNDTNRFLASMGRFAAVSVVPITPQGIGTVTSNYQNVLGNGFNQLRYSTRDSLIYTGGNILNPMSNPPFSVVYSFNIQTPAFYGQINVEPNPFEDALYASYLALDTLKLAQYHSKTRVLIKKWDISFAAERHKKMAHLGAASKIALHTNINIYLFNNCTSSITTKPIITQGSSLNLCTNDSITLSVNTNNKVLWTTGDTTTTIKIKEPGQYAVSFLDAQGCASPPSTYTIVTQVPVPNPPILSSIDPVFNRNISICTGENLLVNASNSDGSGIKWNTGDTSKTLSITQSGTYYAISTNSNGCQTRSNALNVSVLPNLALPKPVIKIVGKTELCSLESAVLQAPSGFNNYIWTTGATTPNITVMPETVDSFAVKVSNTSGCKSAFSDFIKIRRFETPSKPILVYRDSLLQDLLTPTFSHRWYFNGVLMPNITTSTFKPLVNGFYSVQSYIGSCNAPLSDWVNITAFRTGVTDPSVGEIQVYPNPTAQFIRVEIITDNIQTGQLELINMLGQIRQTIKIVPSQNQYELNLTGYTEGSYFLFWRSNEHKVYALKTIIKQ